MEFVPVLDPVGLAVTVEFLPVPQQSRHQTERSFYIHGRILISYDSTPGSTPAYLSPTGPQCTYKATDMIPCWRLFIDDALWAMDGLAA